MELSEPVVVDLCGRYPEWYGRCLVAMDVYRPGLGYWQQVALMKEWFAQHYDAELEIPNQSTLTFPNQERYLECVLTWS